MLFAFVSLIYIEIVRFDIEKEKKQENKGTWELERKILLYALKSDWEENYIYKLIGNVDSSRRCEFSVEWWNGQRNVPSICNSLLS